MSGQPYRYAKDIENFRDNYMEALGLRANLDDMNLQANKIYKATGTIPPKSTEMIDGRTTAEILMDTEKLKLSLYSELKPICTPQMATLVVQRVTNSPLNADGSFLVWFAQNVTELVSNLKKKYKFGIAGNDNDAEQMVLFLQNIYSKTRDMTSSVKTAFDRPAGSGSLGVEVGDFVTLKKQFDEIYLRLVSKATIDTKDLIFKIRERFDGLNDLLNNPPTRYKLVSDKFNELSRISYSSVQQVDLNKLGYSEWIEYTDKIPSSGSLRTLIDQLDKSTLNAKPELSNTILENILAMLPSKTESLKVFRLTDRIIHSTAPPSRAIFGAPEAGILQPPNPDYIGNPLPYPTRAPAGPRLPTTKATGTENFLMNNILGLLVNTMNNSITDPYITDTDKLNVLITEIVNYMESQPHLQEDLSLIHYDKDILIQALKDMTEFTDFNNRDRIRYTVNELKDIVRSIAGTSGFMIGAGLKKRLGRPKGSGLVKPLSERIDMTKGITQGHIHVPFGKYIINKNKLDNDIVSFKHVKGYGVKGYPMSKVSKNLGCVMRTIIGGGIPKFEELNSLTDEEKHYLHKVSEKAGITNKLSIPQPSKDQLEKDIHQFEVMKGEILAGNDSPEVIKKFKLILLKLSRNGTIPKREAMEMIEELLSLGF